MTRRSLTGLVLIGTLVGALVASGASGVAAESRATRSKAHCTVQAYNVSYPQLSGLVFSLLKCSKPFGRGVQEANTKTSLVGTTLNVSATFENFFRNGTNRGTIDLSGAVGSGAISARGSVHIVGGTGAYKHMKATGRATCTTTDVGKTYTCTVTL